MRIEKTKIWTLLFILTVSLIATDLCEAQTTSAPAQLIAGPVPIQYVNLSLDKDFNHNFEEYGSMCTSTGWKNWKCFALKASWKRNDSQTFTGTVCADFHMINGYAPHALSICPGPQYCTNIIAGNYTQGNIVTTTSIWGEDGLEFSVGMCTEAIFVCSCPPPPTVFQKIADPISSQHVSFSLSNNFNPTSHEFVCSDESYGVRCFSLRASSKINDSLTLTGTVCAVIGLLGSYPPAEVALCPGELWCSSIITGNDIQGSIVSWFKNDTTGWDDTHYLSFSVGTCQEAILVCQCQLGTFMPLVTNSIPVSPPSNSISVSPPSSETTTSRACGNIVISDGSFGVKGQVFLNYPQSNTPVCATGIGFNEAKVLCRMSCNSSGDMYALPFMYNSGTAPGPFLNGLRCTGSESHFSQCTFASVNNYDCPYSSSLGLSCSFISSDPQISPPVVSVICQNGIANVALSKSIDSTLSWQNIKLNDTLNSCNPQYTDNGQFVNVIFRFDSCDPLVQANETHISYTTTFLRFHNNNNGVRMVDYVFDVTCSQPKSLLAGKSLNVQTSDYMVQNTTDNTIINLMIYRTPYFEQPVTWPDTTLTGQTLYAVVSLNTGVNQLRFFLGKCWATADNDKNSAVLNLFISNKCAVDNGQIFPINDTTVMFSFKAVEFANLTSNQPTFLWCDTFTCTNAEQFPYCSQVCGSQMPPFLTRRKRSALNNFSVRSTPLRIQKRKR